MVGDLQLIAPVRSYEKEMEVQTRGWATQTMWLILADLGRRVRVILIVLNAVINAHFCSALLDIAEDADGLNDFICFVCRIMLCV